MEQIPFKTGILENGLRWIHQEVRSTTGHIGLLIQVGSRDENPEEEGLAHFIEHLLFKGTKKRKAYHIISRIEDVGGELNAYTGKEETTLYASFLLEHYERSMELIFDIIQNATFPEREIPKEKEVVLDEIDSYRDSPSELIFDDFDSLLYPKHSLGRNILGTEKTVQSFTREQVLDFAKRNYTPERAVLSSVGGINSVGFERLAKKYAANWTGISISNIQTTPKVAAGQRKHIKKEIHQSHLILGGEGISIHDKNYTALVLLNNLLGGPAMNSRLNLNIRERYGIAYQIESFTNSYNDSGIWGVYAGTDTDTIDRCQTLIIKELNLLREKKLGILQFSKAKTQLLGQMALAQENNVNMMTSLGKSMLIFNRVDTFQEIIRKVDSLKIIQIQDLAQQVFSKNKISELRYIPID
ncbi:MAG: putative zinc protease [Owenweeksia sp. TMED14]|nr:MAG: putative zinc protease [Owenweeksia sp. TMED14]|tara:strand:- start:2477 stop:3715 length:1239 start_codon:yes stop_codon:yes gene_type:complete